MKMALKPDFIREIGILARKMDAKLVVDLRWDL